MSQENPLPLYAQNVRAVLDEAYALWMRRVVDYEDSDHPMRTLRLSGSLGVEPWRGCLMRLGDKLSLAYTYARLGSYSSHSETFRETLLDVIGYAAITTILLDKQGEITQLTFDELMRGVESESGGEDGAPKPTD